MRVVWFPANRRYFIAFGDSVVDIDGMYSFETLADVDYVLNLHGLKREGRKVVTI